MVLILSSFNTKGLIFLIMKEKCSEAVKKGERSVNQIENKGEGMHLLGNDIIQQSYCEKSSRKVIFLPI